MLRMRRAGLIVLAIGLDICAIQGDQIQTDNQTTQNEIKALEAQNASASDALVLSGLIADDYVMIGLDGSTSSKPQVINAESGTGKAQVSLKIEQITTFRDTAIVVGKATIPSQGTDGHSVTVEANYSDVWMKRGANWQLVLSHMSPRHPVPAELCLSQQPAGVDR